MIFGCLTQFTKSLEEKASKNTWSLYLAEKVGNIQNLLSRITPSGSAYQPSNIGFPESFLFFCAETLAFGTHHLNFLQFFLGINI
jgi:hypothetical protein